MPPTDREFKTNLQKLIDSPWTLWWVNYLGAVAALIAAVFPAGVSSPQSEDRLKLLAKWEDNDKGTQRLLLSVQFDSEIDPEMFAKELKAIEKVGKKKNWIGGKDGLGRKVLVSKEPQSG